LEHTARPASPEFHRAMLQTSQSLWEKTNVQNLFRYRPSGTYFARFKIGDKPIRQSLETTVFSVAKQRLPEKIREYRSRHESARAFADGKMTVGNNNTSDYAATPLRWSDDECYAVY
jgi:hypothetical protein